MTAEMEILCIHPSVYTSGPKAGLCTACGRPDGAPTVRPVPLKPCQQPNCPNLAVGDDVDCDVHQPREYVPLPSRAKPFAKTRPRTPDEWDAWIQQENSSAEPTVRFVPELPGAGRSKGPEDKFATVLRAHPGQWAIYPYSLRWPGGKQQAIVNGQARAFPAGEFDAAVRNGVLYVKAK